MLQRKLCAAAVTLACASFSSAPLAAPKDELAEIRQQIQAMKAQYESRIAELEKKLGQALVHLDAQAAETGQIAARAESAVAMGAASGVAAPAAPAGSSAVLPEISLILDGKFGSAQRDAGSYAVQGFVPTGGEVEPVKRGFSLGESELGFSANVDHLFRGNARFSIAGETGNNTIATEEANIETLALEGGLKLKAGRFLSGVGYLNVQHPHDWDFVDAPLVYKAFWGGRLSNDGVQLKWVAPTDLFWELGAEAAHGAEFPGATNNRSTPAVSTAFTHVGGEWGISNAWQAGLSLVRSEAQNRTYTDASNVTNAFEGSSHTWVADFVWKWAPDGNSSVHAFKFQSELFSRTEDGNMVYDTSAPVSDTYRSQQRGGYAQAVYQFMPRWRVGYRYDWLDSGNVSFGPALNPASFAELAPYQPRRNSVMVDWSPSEFSRLRLQLARDEARGEGLGDNQLYLQYIMSLGAHGAHKF